jgi:hypothetical protein
VTTLAISLSSSPLVPGTTEVIVLSLFAKTSSWVGLFDRIEVWRSRDTSEGPYEELTAETWAPAQIPKDGGLSSSGTGPKVNIVDKTLQLLVGERSLISVVFTGVDPLNTSDAATQIQAASRGLLTAFVDATGRLVIQTVGPGASASLRIVGGEAAPLLRLPTQLPDSLSFGRDPRIRLLLQEEAYSFSDGQGLSRYFYKARYRNSFTDTVSEFTPAFSGDAAVGVAMGNLIRGTLDLVDSTGAPLRNREVRIKNEFNGTLVQDATVAGTALSKFTDTNGHAEFLLVRGMSITVAIAGTSLVRDVVVPTDPALDSFSLLDPNIGSNDVFKVQVPHLDFAVRRTL